MDVVKKTKRHRPIIGHARHDHRMACNYLKNEDSDKINAILAGCCVNISKLLRYILLQLYKEKVRAIIADLMT